MRNFELHELRKVNEVTSSIETKLACATMSCGHIVTWEHNELLYEHQNIYTYKCKLLFLDQSHYGTKDSIA